MIRAFVLAFVMVTVAGCMANHTERMQDVNPLGWRSGEELSLTYINRDTTCVHRINLLLRWDDNFRGQTLPCVITTIAPDSTSFDEQVDFQIKSGTLLKHTTGYRDSELGYRSGVVLSQIGEYKFIISPVVNDDPIIGVWAAGINICSD